MITHYSNDSANAEWILLSANLEHDESGVTLELREGRWIVDGVASVDSFKSATQLLADVA